jgi:hypothetical protein
MDRSNAVCTVFLDLKEWGIHKLSERGTDKTDVKILENTPAHP